MKLSLMSCGKSLGQRVIDNEHFASYLDTSDQWIRERSGISTRRWVDDESTVDMAVAASQDCLDRLPEFDRSRIEVVICASVTTDEVVPAISAQLQERLGLDKDVLAFDINAACSGLVYALEIARNLLRVRPAGSAALVLGAEMLSRKTDMQDRGSCFLFGDGSGAGLWTLTEGEEDYFAAKTVGDTEMLTVGHEEPIRMDGRAVFRFAVSEMSDCIREVLAKADVAPDEVDFYLLHQANQRINDAIMRDLKLKSERFPSNIARIGNTSSASIGILMEELYSSGQLDGTKTICLAGFGGGMSCGALLMKGHEIHVA
ncbi:MAG: beta-ketoacyl-ACP synthase 3 [Eubacteriales bacterium]|nr:beta-ketoacyl-ACP synthase 3 [Eubacteriales bacterium]MDD4324377.1 beta-ketoacyl-ACP synthase 3 [Eubacteriales bacterium]MDD4541448.1 beta-ketoacyl-ACP synthase 3 [Eubacteriales bacterium]